MFLSLYKYRAGGTGGAIAPPIFSSSSTLAPPIIVGSSTSWGCYSYPKYAGPSKENISKRAGPHLWALPKKDGLSRNFMVIQ